MIDPLLIAVRDGRLGRGMTVPSRHLPFGYARHTNGGLLHRVDRVILEWRNGDLNRIGAAWSCNIAARTTDAGLVAKPEGYSSCLLCDVHDTLPRGQVVYVALCELNGQRVIKVGCSTNLAARLLSLKPFNATLLAAKPGDGRAEKLALASLAKFCMKGREWFSLDCIPALSEAVGMDLPAVLPLEVAS